MKIDIHITDATPEEARHIFSGYHSIRQASADPIPDPTCIEETGCAGCTETGLTDACEQCCSPATATPAKVDRRKDNKPPEPKRGNKFVFGTGTVVARRSSGLIEVRDGGGKIHKVDARCLELVPSAEKKEGSEGVPA